MQNLNWWRDYIISVPRSVSKGYMVGLGKGRAVDREREVS